VETDGRTDGGDCITSRANAIGDVLATITRHANYNKKHLKNVGPIRHCEPPHADVHNNNNDDDDDNDNA